jgi:hypothetical protein
VLEGPTAEQTYRAIGRFIFEFSQLEYSIRHHVSEEISLREEYFSAIVESYDVGVLTSVAKAVFTKSRDEEGAERIKNYSTASVS